MSRENDIKKLVALYSRRLQKLKEQQALKGIDAPPQTLIEIEGIEAKIETLQATLVNMASDSSSQTTPPLDINDELARLEQLELSKSPQSGHRFNMQGASIKAGIINQGGEQNFDAPISVDMSETITHVEAGGTYVGGDQFSGDFRGAIINIKSQLENVTQTIEGLPATHSEKEQLFQLIEELKQQLEQVPTEQIKEAEKVTKRVEALAEELDTEEPDKEMIEITAASLKRAAQNLAKVTPTVLPITTQIVNHIFKLSG